MFIKIWKREKVLILLLKTEEFDDFCLINVIFLLACVPAPISVTVPKLIPVEYLDFINAFVRYWIVKITQLNIYQS